MAEPTPAPNSFPWAAVQSAVTITFTILNMAGVNVRVLSKADADKVKQLVTSVIDGITKSGG